MQLSRYSDWGTGWTTEEPCFDFVQSQESFPLCTAFRASSVFILLLLSVLFCSFPYYASCFCVVLLFCCFALMVFFGSVFLFFCVLFGCFYQHSGALFAICNPNWSVATVCCKLTTEHNGGLCCDVLQISGGCM